MLFVRLQAVLAVWAAASIPGALARVRPQAIELSFLLRPRVFGSSIFGSIIFAPFVDRRLVGSLIVGIFILCSTIGSIVVCNFFLDRVSIIGVVPSCFVTRLPPSPTFACDGLGFLVQSNRLSRVDIATGGVTPVIETIPSGSVNALGYNTLDGYLYGIQFRADDGLYHIVRIGSDNAVTSVGNAGGNAIIGDIDSDGMYWVASASSSEYHMMDLVPGSDTYGTVLESGTVDTLGYIISDWSYASFGGNYLYTIATGSPGENTSSFLRFNKTTRTWAVLRHYTGTPNGVWGALYAFDADNAIYAADNASGEIWKFPLDGSDATFVSQSSSASPNDGASCRAGQPIFP
ncbi:hypothetical protein QBC34DRAFT_460563 [Podospora aff. communis PSN243]|uniref:DUF6923 domain-containing protein n=1 Tax=Podospora aff. communis PSN243 TaxID=3040156 RepID=A0AAV9H3E1_9PEZI|nr:hypothetical protein QBC34DRAFT_460563 [Podospora aff. communis PSN243]